MVKAYKKVASQSSSFGTHTGHVYGGSPPDTSSPVAGVTVQLYGDQDEWPESGPKTLLASTTTSGSGAFILGWEQGEQFYPYFHVIEVDPPGTYLIPFRQTFSNQRPGNKTLASSVYISARRESADDSLHKEQ